MYKPTIALNTYDRDYNGLVALGNAVDEGIEGNSYYPSPSPALPALRLAIDKVVDGIAKRGPEGNRGSSTDLARLRADTRHLWIYLKALADYVSMEATLIAGNNYPLMASIIASSRFPMRNNNRPQGLLEKVQGFQVVFARNLNRNQRKVSWERPLNLNSRHNVRTYLRYMSTTPNFADAVQISSGRTTSFIFTNDTGETQTYYLWVVPYNSAGMGAVSDMLVVTLLPM